jgi:CHRD domain
MHIHGPAGPGTNAPVTIVLDTYNFRATDPTLGGVVYGQVPIPTEKVAELLANLYYINIHTANYLEGEIRGQLVAEINRPPVVACPEPVTAECGSLTTVTTKVSDPEGDALVVVWSVNGTAIQTNELAAGATTSATEVNFPAEFPLGTNQVSVAATDSDGNSATCSTTVTVVDTIPPVIARVTATPNCIWPPNHKMVEVKVEARVTDVCGPTRWKIISIKSNQAVHAKGSGHTEPDWEITGPHTANLRAERSGKDGARIYTITVQAVDQSGNKSERKSVDVIVAHDRGRGK